MRHPQARSKRLRLKNLLYHPNGPLEIRNSREELIHPGHGSSAHLRYSLMVPSPKRPHVFISYAWQGEKDSQHNRKVLRLASDLGETCLVELDQWAVTPGTNVHAFMERMVNDPTINKVIIVCDRTYVQKSQNGLGGVGTETTIMTPSIYAQMQQRSFTQGEAPIKFIPVVFEYYEGKACVPTMLASATYIDLSTDERYNQNIEELERALWDHPLLERPQPDRLPHFIESLDANEAAAKPLSEPIPPVETVPPTHQEFRRSVMSDSDKEPKIHQTFYAPATVQNGNHTEATLNVNYGVSKENLGELLAQLRSDVSTLAPKEKAEASAELEHLEKAVSTPELRTRVIPALNALNALRGVLTTTAFAANLAQIASYFNVTL